MKKEPSILRNFMIIGLLAAGVIPVVLFLVKWLGSSFDETWETFDSFIYNCFEDT